MKQKHLKSQQKDKKPSGMGSPKRQSGNNEMQAHFNPQKDVFMVKAPQKQDMFKVSPQTAKNTSGHELTQNTNAPTKSHRFSRNEKDSTAKTKQTSYVEVPNQKKNQLSFFKQNDKKDNKTEISDYDKLNDKLSYLEDKIKKLNLHVDRKREDKLQFLELQRNQRIEICEEKVKKPIKAQKEKEKNKEKDIEPKKDQQNNFKKFITQVNYQRDFRKLNYNPYSPRNNIYYVSEVIKGYREQKSIVREHLVNSMQFLRMFEYSHIPSLQELGDKCQKLQRKVGKDKKTVVFDLDQTLIHCNQTLDNPYDIKITIKFPTGEHIEAGINIRPYAFELLKALSRNFQIIVYTASHSCYADIVLDHLDPQRKYIHHRLFREHCYCTVEGIYVKDLRVVGRDLSQVVLIDNAAYSYAYQVHNGIPIIPYYEGKDDFELKVLQTYLESLIFVKDVREQNKKTFKLKQYSSYTDPQQLVRELYE